jgi:hypothetical protein
MDWYNGFSPEQRNAMGRALAPSFAREPPCAMCGDPNPPKMQTHTQKIIQCHLAGSRQPCIRYAFVAIVGFTQGLMLPCDGNHFSSFCDAVGTVAKFLVMNLTGSRTWVKPIRGANFLTILRCVRMPTLGGGSRWQRIRRANGPKRRMRSVSTYAP